MIYFDNSATTQVNPEALDTYIKVTKDIWGNPSSLHKFGDRSHQLLEASRNQIAKLLGVNSTEIYFTASGSESDNWAIKGTALAKKAFGKHIITSSVEHAAVSHSIRMLENEGFDVTVLPVDSNSLVDPKDLANSIRSDTILVSIMGVNNEIGAIQPIEEISKILEKYPNITFHVDNVQALGKAIWSRVFTSRVDLMSLSAHKFHAPRGVGILYKKHGKMLVPLIDGGGQEGGLRSGTENLPAIAATAKAMRLYLANEKDYVARENQIKEKIINYLSHKPGIHIFSPINDNFVSSILCFALEGIRGETLVHTLEKYDIYISTTSACSSRSSLESSTLQAMRIDNNIAESAVRLSFDDTNTLEEAKQFIEIFDGIYQHFAKINHLN